MIKFNFVSHAAATNTNQKGEGGGKGDNVYSGQREHKYGNAGGPLDRRSVS